MAEMSGTRRGRVAQRAVGDALDEHGRQPGDDAMATSMASDQPDVSAQQGCRPARPCRYSQISSSTPTKAPMAKISLWAKLMNSSTP